jgi:hypothetical protein
VQRRRVAAVRGQFDSFDRSHDECKQANDSQVARELGAVCAEYHDRNVRDVICKRIQLDEIWSFVGAKQKNLPEENAASGVTCGRGRQSMPTPS